MAINLKDSKTEVGKKVFSRGKYPKLFSVWKLCRQTSAQSPVSRAHTNLRSIYHHTHPVKQDLVGQVEGQWDSPCKLAQKSYALDRQCSGWRKNIISQRMTNVRLDCFLEQARNPPHSWHTWKNLELQTCEKVECPSSRDRPTMMTRMRWTVTNWIQKLPSLKKEQFHSS